MRLTTLLSSVAASVLASAPLVAQSHSGDYTAKRDVSAPLGSAKVIRIHAEAGWLRIEGKAGLKEVHASGTAYASSRTILEQVRLLTRREGDAIEVWVETPERRSNWDDDWSAGLDLTIDVPSTVALDVEDGSGDLEIRNVGPLELHDGSGGIRIEHVAGDVRLEDGSGEIVVEDVKGSVDVPKDGSGTLEIRDVTGGVRVGSKGSGEIDVDRVGGDLVVERKGSGEIDYRDVKGKVDLPVRYSRADRRRWR